MSGFDNPTNRGRIERAIEALGHVEKSAKSNRADAAAIEALLVPLLVKLGDLGIVTTQGHAPAETPAPVRRSGVVRVTLRDIVRRSTPAEQWEAIQLCHFELDGLLHDGLFADHVPGRHVLQEDEQ